MTPNQHIEVANMADEIARLREQRDEVVGHLKQLLKEIEYCVEDGTLDPITTMIRTRDARKAIEVITNSDI